MELRRDLLLGIGALITFNLLMSWGAVGALSRMRPAIERIFSDNLRSIEAAEDMLIVVAKSEGERLAPSARQRFFRAYDRAAKNISEENERATLRRIREYTSTAFEGDSFSNQAMIEELRHLIQDNRVAMNRVEREALRLSTAGAWFAIFVALFCFMMGMLVVRRVNRQILDPIVALFETVEAVRAGDRHRRCLHQEGPVEIRRILDGVNFLLDRRNQGVAAQEASASELERAAIHHLLEAMDKASFIVDPQGQVAAANRAGLELLSSDEGETLRAALAQAPFSSSQQESQGELGTMSSAPLGGGKGWLCTFERHREHGSVVVEGATS